jgi:hypothetical protein
VAGECEDRVARFGRPEPAAGGDHSYTPFRPFRSQHSGEGDIGVQEHVQKMSQVEKYLLEFIGIRRYKAGVLAY